jgi:hypothetical protein
MGMDVEGMTKTTKPSQKEYIFLRPLSLVSSSFLLFVCKVWISHPTQLHVTKYVKPDLVRLGVPPLL